MVCREAEPFCRKAEAAVDANALRASQCTDGLGRQTKMWRAVAAVAPYLAP